MGQQVELSAFSKATAMTLNCFNIYLMPLIKVTHNRGKAYNLLELPWICTQCLCVVTTKLYLLNFRSC